MSFVQRGSAQHYLAGLVISLPLRNKHEMELDLPLIIGAE